MVCVEFCTDGKSHLLANFLPFSPRLLPHHFSFLKALQLLHSGCWEALLKKDNLQHWVYVHSPVSQEDRGSWRQMGTVLMRAGKLHVLLASRRLTMKSDKAKSCFYLYCLLLPCLFLKISLFCFGFSCIYIFSWIGLIFLVSGVTSLCPDTENPWLLMADTVWACCQLLTPLFCLLDNS